MGCAGSKPEEEVPTKTVADDEMAAVRAKLAEARAKEDAKAAEGGETAGSEPFRRKFKGFQAGGGSKHNIKRAVDMSPEAVAERERINAEIKRKREEREAKMNPIQRQMTRAFTRTSSSFSSSTRSLKAWARLLCGRSRVAPVAPAVAAEASLVCSLVSLAAERPVDTFPQANSTNQSQRPKACTTTDTTMKNRQKTEKSKKTVGFAAPEDPWTPLKLCEPSPGLLRFRAR